MAITFDPTNRRIILDSASVTAVEIWSRWCDWAATGDNLKWAPAMRQVGGDDLGSGLLIPAYIFLMNGWRVRPMEANHTLTIEGNLFVEGGGNPVVSTLGVFNVLVNMVVPVQAQALNIGSGGGSNIDANQIAEAVWQKMLSNGKTSGDTLIAAEQQANKAALLDALR